MADANARGRFVWYNLMTNDPKKAEAFYQKVAGWGTQVWDGQQPYTMWTVERKPNRRRDGDAEGPERSATLDRLPRGS